MFGCQHFGGVGLSVLLQGHAIQKDVSINDYLFQYRPAFKAAFDPVSDRELPGPVPYCLYLYDLTVLHLRE